jgi:hypothetical protein
MGQPMSTWKTEEERGALEADMPAARALASDTQEWCQDPKSPWSATVHMAQAVGVARTAKMLRLAYYSVMRPSVRRRNTGSSGTLPAERSKTHLCVGF